MNKASLIGFATLIALLLSFTSCSEKDEAGEYDNWRSRNEKYIEQIASEARINADGSWTIIKAHNTGDEFDDKQDPKFYIYVQKLESGTGTYNPKYNDSIRVHYSGRLIPSDSYEDGYNFGKSYVGATLNESTDVPSLMAVKENIRGFATALQHMVEGDHWRVIIPAYLGYYKSTPPTGNIPKYSTLIFDVKLARIYRYKVDTNTSWH